MATAYQRSVKGAGIRKTLHYVNVLAPVSCEIEVAGYLEDDIVIPEVLFQYNAMNSMTLVTITSKDPNQQIERMIIRKSPSSSSILPFQIVIDNFNYVLTK